MSISQTVRKQATVSFRSPSPVISARPTASIAMTTSQLPQPNKAVASCDSKQTHVNVSKRKMQPNKCPTGSVSTTSQADHYFRHASEVAAKEYPNDATSFKTCADETTAVLASHLERFHRLVAAIGGNQLSAVRECVDALLAYVLPRLAKLGNRVGLKVIGSIKTGSIYDNTTVIGADEVDVLVMFDPSELTTVMADPGYVTIPLSAEAGTEKPTSIGCSSSSGSGTTAAGVSPRRSASEADRWKFGRSADKKFLSPVVVSKTMYKIVERIANGSIDTVNEFHLLPFEMASNRSPIVVVINRWMSSDNSTSNASLRVNMIASCAVCDTGDNLPPAGTITYVVARPYQYDRNPRSNSTWRLSTVDREMRILDWADRADRGARLKAIRILKALVRVEPQLYGLSSYHVRTAALYTFDRIVDESSCWQRQSTVSAFLDVLTELDQHLTHGCMPHFFFRQLDLLAGVPIQTVQKWRSRIRYLVENPGAIIRVLRRRTEDRLTSQTTSDAKTI